MEQSVILLKMLAREIKLWYSWNILENYFSFIIKKRAPDMLKDMTA